MNYYLIFGLGFYTSLAVYRKHTFKNHNLPSKIRGFVFGVLAWPVIIYIKLTEK